MVRHVALVGLMGAGKTTVGRRLARLLDREFVDADDALEEITDRTIAEIFESDGERGFRALESDVLEELLEHHEPTVIATGGGVVLSGENRSRLAQASVTVVWLDASPAFLASRVDARSRRPLLAGSESPRQALERLHSERHGLYRSVADIRVEVEPFHTVEDRTKLALAERIAQLVRTHEAGSREAAPT